jgi:hypothetical protein
VPEPHELGSRPKDGFEDIPEDYTVNVEVWRDSLWLSIQGGAQKARFHPSERSETRSRNLRRVQNRKRIMRSGITQTNGNEARKHDENWNKNIDERKPTYQITNDKLNIYDDYAMIPGSTKPCYIRAAELRGQMDIDGRIVEKTPD